MTLISNAPCIDGVVQVQPTLWKVGADWGAHYIYGKWFTSELCCFWIWRFLVWTVWRAGQDEQQGPGVGQGSGKCACVGVALERKTTSFMSHETQERRNCSESNAVCTSDCLDAHLWLWGKCLDAILSGGNLVFPLFTPYCGSIWEPQSWFRAPLCRELMMSRAEMVPQGQAEVW